MRLRSGHSLVASLILAVAELFAQLVLPQLGKGEEKVRFNVMILWRKVSFVAEAERQKKGFASRQTSKENNNWKRRLP